MIEREVVFIVDCPPMQSNGWSFYPKNFTAHFQESKAQSLVENGYALFKGEIQNQINSGDNNGVSYEPEFTQDTTLSQLKETAKERGIKGYYKMSKSELLEALNV